MTHRDFAISLAKQAGDIIRKNFTLGMKKSWKQDDTPLTATDTAINDLVVRSVTKQYPRYGLITEESGTVNDSTEYVWVCDPLDGTIPFSHGIPTCAFSLALVHDGKPVLGVIYDPFMDRLFVGEHPKETTLNGKRTRVSEAKELRKSLVCMSFWNRAIDYDYRGLAYSLNQTGAAVIGLGSIVYSGALVASGQLIATIWPGQTVWDIAALKIIVEEAGGKVTDLHGNEQRYDQPINGAIASNGHMHDQLLDIINR